LLQIPFVFSFVFSHFSIINFFVQVKFFVLAFLF